MSEPIKFPLGHHVAEFPLDRQYSRNHMWALSRGDVFRCGFTAYAVHLMQDVYFLEWVVEAGTTLQHRQEIGAIESKKAESALYAPMAGKLTQFNQSLLSDPSYINLSPYDQGWLFDIQAQDPQLLSAHDYRHHLVDVWQITSPKLKGRLS